jgi:hypothetical protein
MPGSSPARAGVAGAWPVCKWRCSRRPVPGVSPHSLVPDERGGAQAIVGGGPTPAIVKRSWGDQGGRMGRIERIEGEVAKT